MIATVTCYFNPCHYENSRRNMKEFLRSYKGPDLHMIELSFDGQFESDAEIKIKGDPKRNLLWQKERLLNILINSLPAKYDKVAWIDADVLLLNNWWDTAEYMLDNGFRALQPFSWASLTNEKLEIERRYCSISYKFCNPDFKPPVRMYPSSGFAWVARRDCLPDGKLLDFHITGNGDSMMVNAWLANFVPESHPINKKWHLHYLKEAAKHYRMIRQRVGYVPGELLHIYHGSWDNRKYNQRARYLTEHDYDPVNDIAIDEENGLWRWTGTKPELEKVVANYFYERKEDE